MTDDDGMPPIPDAAADPATMALRRIAREEIAAFMAGMSQRLMPTVVQGCPRRCLTNTVCLRVDCPMRVEGT